MFDFQRNLIAPHELKRLLPLDKDLAELKRQNDIALKETIKSKSKFVVVCGPCAADDADAVAEYSKMLGSLAEKVKQKIFMVQRVFTAKPRSLGEGYLGMLFERDQSGQTDLNKGLIACRKLFIQCLRTNGLPVADELLFLEQYEYFDDLVSYYFLGARTSESAPHRNFASGLEVPVGIKNPVSGNLKSLSEALYCVLKPKTCLRRGDQYLTSGNESAHVVLRGQFSEDGTYKQNCDKKSVSRLFRYADGLKIPRPFVLVDCSHANSGKSPLKQIGNALKTVKELYPDAGGVMLESYINEGNSDTAFGTSRTDPCLSFRDTEKLVTDLYGLLP